MRTFTDRYEDQPINPVDVYYKVDQKKLVKWLKHMAKLNQGLMNDVSRDNIQRGIDKGRYETYSGILQLIHLGTIITK